MKTGYRNIITLVSKSYLDVADAAASNDPGSSTHSDGVILLSGGRARRRRPGAVARRCRDGRAAGRAWRSVYGDRYYLELQRTHRDDDDRYCAAAVALAM